MPETLAERFADYALSIDYEDLTDAAIHETKRRLIDTLGCTLGAWDGDAPRAAQRVAATQESKRGAHTLYGTLTSVDMAAFVNGVLIRYLDFNDTYLSKEPAHPSDNFAATLAAAEVAGASGQDLIAATVIAYEIQCRLADAWSIRAEGWDHVCYGSFSTVLGAGKILGLNREQLVHAQGISGNAHMAMRQTRAGELSMWKGAAFANAARNGVLSVLLAAEGMTGPAPIFEGEMGFFAEVAHGNFEIPALGGQDGADYMLPGTYIKYWPAEYHSQSAIDAALQLRVEIGDASEIESVTIETFTAAIEIIADPEKWRPKTRETADHSLPYCVGVALVDGEVGLPQFAPERFSDESLLDLVSRIEVKVDAELDKRYPESIPNRITVRTRSGDSVTREVAYPKGHVGNPMSDDEVEAKFRAQADGRLSEATQAAALARLWALEEETDIEGLLGMFAEAERVKQ
ncbi:MAG: MmgE/PrpD family protein [Chloroflexi bacterium]|nr:MmgE/PrpD family protein [Chloroflexota bacterium]